MIQKDTIRAAGVGEKDIQELEAAWEKFQCAKRQPPHSTPHIVCTGIYNAGKSTLLNALAGKELFPTGDIPTTKKITQAEFDGAVYIDTPGLNAAEEDDQETQAAYESADFILFVSNAQNGGISEAEASWLKKLLERYGSLRQRLTFVLTHCAQVDAEQLPAIQERICRDFAKAVGFELEQVLCVDSITYQDGIAGKEPLLVEHSGIPQLKRYLAEHITDAEKLLKQAHDTELKTARRNMLVQIECCQKTCQQNIQRISARKHLSDIGTLFTNAETSLAAMTSSSAALYGGMSFVKGGETFEGKDGSSLKSSARNHVRNFAEEVLDEAKDATQRVFDRAHKDYGTTGLDSAYFKKCSEINRLLEGLQADLLQRGIQLAPYQEIDVEPNIARFDEELSRYQDDSSYWSAREYFNIFENRIDVNKYDYGYEERGLFGGTKWVPKYVIYTSNATYEIDKKISKTFSGIMERATNWVDRFYWKPFLKELCTVASNRLSEMRKAAEANILAAGRAAEEPYQTALSYLDTLAKEVSQ